MPVSLADMKRALGLCLTLFACTSTAGEVNGELVVAGSFSQLSDKDVCVVQL
jgi:hypothetical protein